MSISEPAPVADLPHFSRISAKGYGESAGFKQGLGLIWFGEPPESMAGQTSGSIPDLPFLSISMPLLLGETAGGGELWQGRPGATELFEGIRYRGDETALFGVLTLEDKDNHLAADSQSVYERIFRLLDHAGYPHLWRTWNFLTDIHGSDQGLERYQQFNIGRQAAYDAFSQPAASTAPAACALGIQQGGFRVGFLAGRKPPVLLENPRQTSAYHYPDTYGPRSPTFSRATLIPLENRHLLLISGTASIVGHESRHIGNVRAQTRETLTNISEIVAQANDRLPDDTGFLLAQLQWRVYVRRPEDADAVRRELRVCLGKKLNMCFVQADVCRQELLVEIEASGLSVRL
ncbi:MAG: chorismate transformation enzyme, FkbO/Hyg5 family [Halothiobacillus sp.]